MAKEKDILKSFGKTIKRIRKEKGFDSQMDLALKSGLDRSYIGGVERGERNISLVNISKLAKVLGVKIKDLFN